MQTYSPEMNLLPGVTDAELAGRAAVSPAAGGVAAIELLGDLRQAIADGELTLVYQPKIDLTTERVVGVEALVALAAPGRPGAHAGAVPAAGPPPWADGVGDRVRPQPCARRCGEMARRPMELPVAVNLFAPSLANLGIPDTITRALADRGLDAANLTIEITEDMLR